MNFSLFSRDATSVELLLFDRVDDASPSRTVTLDPRLNRTYHYWHVFVPGVGPGQLYGYRVAGPNLRGFRFDPEKLLFDPYGRALAVPAGYSRVAATEPGDNAAICHEERGGRSARVRLGGGYPSEAPLLADHHL